MNWPTFDLKKCKVEKMPAVCLKVLNQFLKFNIAEINEQLLLGSGDNAGHQQMPSDAYQLLTTDRLSLGGQLPETKYLQILKAQSQKLKSRTNFRHIQKLLCDLRDKLAMQSSNGDSHLFQMIRDE